MKLSKAIGAAAAASAMLIGLAVPASASGLMNVTTSGTTSIYGTIDSTTTSWDKYDGTQLSLSVTGTSSGATGTNVTNIGTPGSGSNSNGYGQSSHNFAAQASITHFAGGDTSNTHINGSLNQIQTNFATGVSTSFGY
jgi:hypothetical protein